MKYRWDYDYASLAKAPVIPGKTPWAASIYRGLVPAKNILNRDFAVSGATVPCLFLGIPLPALTVAQPHEQFTAHPAYVCEVSAHWISAYFQRDALRLPHSIGEALGVAEYDGAWVLRRYPHTLNWIDYSNTSAVAFWK
jgi:hypothetical protein